jgi:single-strand DNA-binding protein
MNSISISGNLGKQCETRALPDGTQVVTFSVADSQGRDKPSIWWNCSMFGKRGEALAPYLTKGQTVTVIGTVSEREWVDKDGQKRKSTDVRVSDVALQGGRQSDGDASAPRQSAPKQAPKNSGGSSGFDSMDEDIPFNDPMKNRAFALSI